MLRSKVMKLVVLLLFFPLLSAQPLDPAFNDDVLGLIVFKAGLIDPQSRLTSWNEEDDTPCNWVGVKCDQTTRRVTELILDGFSLSGHIGRSLIRLQSLTTLQLSRNNISGTINTILSQIPSLKVIDLSENSLSGSIPQEIFQQCGALKSISLANNNLTGTIPDSLTSCSTLERVNFSSNHLSGPLPSGIGSLTSVRSLDFSYNMLQGEVPKGIESLSDLRVISLRNNSFGGWLPQNIGNWLMIKSIDFGGNYITGELPKSMSKLGNCRYLDLSGNLLTGDFPEWIGEMRTLEFLDLSSNKFSGSLPSTIGNLQSLQVLNLSNAQIRGTLPESIENCMSLKVLDAGQNLFSGNLPLWILKLPVEIVSLPGNRYNGSISLPDLWLQSYQSLRFLDLSSNSLSGEIPSAIGKFSMLQYLNVSRNALLGPIPEIVGKLNLTRVLDLSHNQISGKIPPEIGEANSLQVLRLESNSLTGEIPEDIANCSSLTSLVLSQNNLTGSIPPVLTSLAHLELVDLSHNNLSGNLPKELSNLSHLITFNVSYNNLEGELPEGGFFNIIPQSSIAGNPSLCGSITKHSCPSVHPKPLVLNPNSSVSNHGGPFSPNNMRHKRIMLSISSLIAIGAAVFIALGVVTVSVLNMHARSAIARSAAQNFAFSGGDEFSPSHDTEANYGKLVMFSGEASFVSGAQALLNKDCELGRGGFGSVYRTELRGGRLIAIKKLNTTSLVKNQEDFEREVKILGKIRHENLVTLEGYYWTPSLQLLINEYFSEGSLYKHLHDQDSNASFLTWPQRFEIILGTAKGLAHLHWLNIIHYNMKSTNVLLDDSGRPKVGDFGLARLLPALDRYVLSGKIQSALGYMAPEFACGTVKITEKCDVYGFGILILEIISGKRPVEYLEDDVIVLCDVVRGALDGGKVEECIDRKLNGDYPIEVAIPILKLGLVCASQVPSNRPDMEEVVRILELIKCPPSENQGDLE